MGEQGRKPLPIFMWLVVLGLVVAEALGFAYVLAGYTLPGASESLQQKGALGIAFVLSAILVGLTHAMGGELYSNSVIKRFNRIWSEERRNLREEEKQEFSPNYDTLTIETNEVDDNSKRWQQVLNRIKKWEEGRVLSIVTVVFIVIVAVGATYIRGQVLEKQLIQEISSATTNVYESAPAELGELQANADDKALKEQQDADRKGGWATFIVLAVLFVFIQILGILFGFKWGFAGNQSKNAHKEIHRFKNLTDYENYYSMFNKQVEAKANEKLSQMKDKIKKIKSPYPMSEGKSFAEYIKQQDDEARKQRINEALKDEREKLEIEHERNKLRKQMETLRQESANPTPTTQNSEISSTNSATQNIQPQDLAQTDTKDDLSANKNMAESANRIAQLNKTIAKLEENKANLLKNGADEFDNEILDIDSKIDKAKEKLKGLENA